MLPILAQSTVPKVPPPAKPLSRADAAKAELRGALMHLSSVAGEYAAAKQGKRQVTDAEVSSRLALLHAVLGRQEAQILDELGADPKLFQQLRATFQQAIDALMQACAETTHRRLEQVYLAHEDEIPDWAMPKQKVSGITMPLPPDAMVDPLTNESSFQVGTVRVVVLPDEFQAAESETTFAFDRQRMRINFETEGNRVSHFNPPELVLFIKTRYATGEGPEGLSQYGRGTTREDIAAGHTSLGFHESRHGVDFRAFLRKNPAPVFTGAKGNTVTQFRKAMAEFFAAVQAYSARMDAFSKQATDCVGNKAGFCKKH